MNHQILLYEELSFNSHPSLKTQYYDGWILRYSNGFTNRANSVNMIYPSTINLQTKIEECEKRYSEQKLPCVFKVTDGSEEGLDGMLEERGYQVVTPTMLMIMDLQNKNFVSSDCIITPYADDEWLRIYFDLCRVEKLDQKTAKEMMDAVMNTTLNCRIVENDKSIACATAIIERGYVILLNVNVEEKYRGRGFGRQLCESLLCEAKLRGAHTSYLQVVHNNKIAINLYEKLGFKKVYSYWYRVKEM